MVLSLAEPDGEALIRACGFAGATSSRLMVVA